MFVYFIIFSCLFFSDLHDFPPDERSPQTVYEGAGATLTCHPPSHYPSMLRSLPVYITEKLQSHICNEKNRDDITVSFFIIFFIIFFIVFSIITRFHYGLITICFTYLTLSLSLLTPLPQNVKVSICKVTLWRSWSSVSSLRTLYAMLCM